MAYSTIPKGNLYMNTLLYTGNGSTNNVTGVGFTPDWVWFKSRNNADDHNWFDKPRGVTKLIESNTTSQETTQSNGLTAFNSDGYTLESFNAGNRNGGSFVAWNWKANGQGSSNTDGSINTTYTSANTTAGFSMITYTGNGSSGATVGHGLGSVPQMFITKRLNAAASGIVSQHQIIPGGNPWDDNYIVLNDPDARSGALSTTGGNGPTSSVIYLGNDNAVNGNGSTYMTYAFAGKKGYSKFSSYVGNGNAEGTFTYTGFTPSWIMVKCSSNGSRSWSIFDNKRSPFNISQNTLLADTTGVEITNGNNGSLDILSNGFKMRNTDAGTNGSGLTYIYMAFASNPFVATSGSDAIPVTAR